MPDSTSKPGDPPDIGMEYPVITEVYGGEDMMSDPDTKEAIDNMDNDDGPSPPAEPEHNVAAPHRPGKPRIGRVHVHVHRGK